MKFCQIILIVGMVLLVNRVSAVSNDNIPMLKSQAAAARGQIVSRFLSPGNIMYDYVGLKGEVVLPTAQECRESKPNALAWWTPIENGGFFNGIYLIALCDDYEQTKNTNTANLMRKIATGLYKLQDVGETPGFIARGVSEDGKSHYIASSDDQNIPWLLGLWRYYKSSAISDEERKECGKRISKHVLALQKANWQIVGDKPDFVRGYWLSHEQRDSIDILMTTRIMFDVTSDKAWLEMHYKLLHEKMKNGRTRLEIISDGFSEVAEWSAWFTATVQYAVRELMRAESDQKIKQKYAGALKTTALAAEHLIPLYKKYDYRKKYHFTPDWRVMLKEWKPQHNSSDAQKIAMKEVPLWNQKCPAVRMEKVTLKPSITASWIVLLSDDKEIIDKNLPEIVRAVKWFKPERCHYATFFYVENVVYELMRQNNLKPEK